MFDFMGQTGKIAVAPRSSEYIVTTSSEKAASRIESPVYPWITGFVFVLDHPYAAVSDEDGELTIKNLPAGKPLTFKLWHENSNKSIETVTFEDKPETWRKGNVVLTLKPGMNDLGKVKLAPKNFRPL